MCVVCPSVCTCTCVGLCASARAHVYTLPEIRSFLGRSSLHPEVFADPFTQVHKTKPRGRAGLGRPRAGGVDHRVGVGVAAGGAEAAAAQAGARSRAPTASSRRRGAAGTARG